MPDVPRPQEIAPVPHSQIPTPSLPAVRSKLEPLLRPLHAFLSAESAGGIVLMAAAVAALAWANSPWDHAYHAFWRTKLGVGAGAWSFAMTLQHWVNDALMVVFFLLVG